MHFQLEVKIWIHNLDIATEMAMSRHARTWYLAH